MNRTQSHAEDLAAKYREGTVVPFCDIKEVLSEVDVCICSVGAPHYILEKDTVQKVMSLRAGRELTFIDISMPRNIDPAVSAVEGVQLYAIDDLKEAVDSNMKARANAVGEVERIIDAKEAEFLNKLNKPLPVPTDRDWEEDAELSPSV